MTGIYAIVNVLTGRRYIGRSVDIERRWADHKSALDNGTHDNLELQYDWASAGQMEFQFTVLELCDGHEASKQRERAYLAASVGLYNKSSSSGQGPKPGSKLSPEQISRLRAAVTGKPKSASHRAKLSAARKGQKFPKHAEALRGRKLSDETRARMSATHKCRHAEHPRDEAHRAKLSEALKGRAITWGAKISATKTGKPWSVQRRAAMEASRLVVAHVAIDSEQEQPWQQIHF